MMIARLLLGGSILTFSVGSALPEAPQSKLLWGTPKLERSIKREFNGARGNYIFTSSSPVGDQLIGGMDVDMLEEMLPNGNHLISGCRRRHCDSKGAVIAGEDGTAIAAAMIHFPCKFMKLPACDPYLTIFVKPRTKGADVIEPLKQWAARMHAKYYAGIHDRIVSTHIVVVP